MTAKHRRGKSNHKHEDNFFKNDVVESEARGGANNYALHLVLFLLIVVGGATGAWFCFQQHQTLTYLTDNLMGMQMKIVRLQSSQEEMRQSSNKHISESLETRLNALEESYALAQKQVGMALATAEQLRTSDLPAQVLSLHTEMKTRLSEMQQATVSLEQLSQLQTMLKGKSEEFEGVRIQVEGLATVSDELSQKVGVLTGSLGEAESKLEERGGQVAALSVTLDGQVAEVLGLKEQLQSYQAQLEASTQEMAAVRELLQSEQSQQASVEEQQQLNTPEESQPPAEPVEQTEEEGAPAAEEEAAEASNLEEAEEGEGGEAAAQDEAPVEQEDSVTDETAPEEEVEAAQEDQTEEDETGSLSEKEEVDAAQTAEVEQSVEEEAPEEEAPEEEKVQEEPVAPEEEADEGEEPLDNALPEDE